MRTVAKLFGRSPFVSLRLHMEKVAECVDALGPLFDAFRAGDHEALAAQAKVVSKLEHKADLVKNDLRNHLPKGLFLAIDRANLLSILSMQDSIADQAEDIAITLTLKPMPMFPAFEERFEELLSKNIEAFHGVRAIIEQLDDLIETGFGGAEATRVNEMVEGVALLEHEVDKIQRALLMSLFEHEDELSKGAFILWSQLFNELAGLSNISENLANRVRMTLVLK